LDSKHTFSFGDYWDPAHLGFGVLRVINEDRIAPGASLPPRPHRDMEVVSSVLSGALEHRASMGTGSTVLPGQLQYLSAGSGVTYTKHNALKEGTTHLYQFWIAPDVRGGAPRYAQHQLDQAHHNNRFGLLAGGARFHAPIELRQDASLAAASLSRGSELEHVLDANRKYWLQVMHGSVEVHASASLVSGNANVSSSTSLNPGDGLAIAELQWLRMTATSDAEVLLFDLPKTN